MTTAPLGPTAMDFRVPDELKTRVPPEFRGLQRDDVRMLVAFRGSMRVEHSHLRDLIVYLDPPDLLVINTSATLPAALPATSSYGPATLHLSTQLSRDAWTVELRDQSRSPWNHEARPVAPGRVTLPDGGRAELIAPYGENQRLWLATLELPGPLHTYLARHGSPIRYDYTDQVLPLDAYQTVYATEPGSAEMPSAGRGFTTRLITNLVAGGVDIAPLVLHAGVSSLESDETPYPEPYVVPPDTARRVNAARAAGGRIVAVGTTVVRALESVADDDGFVHARDSWTDLVVTPERGVRSVDALLTGWHEPRASHLALVEAVAGEELLRASYEAALDDGYLWHEFGDLHLILPPSRR
jgi:S-adenosylmethionine:tRNA ribosyltransferase-isomerase